MDHTLDIASTVRCFDVVVVVVVGSEFTPDEWTQERLRDTYLACGSQLQSHQQTIMLHGKTTTLLTSLSL
jgi:hypothetical protein